MKAKSATSLILTNFWKCILVLCVMFIILQAVKNCSLRKHASHQKNELNSEIHFRNSKTTFANSLFPLVKEFSLEKYKRFDNEDARKIGFKLKFYSNITRHNIVTKVIYLATTYFNEWNPRHYYFLHLGNDTFKRYKCPIYNCYATNDPSSIKLADALIFHVRDLEVFSFPNYRNTKQIWILYSMEPPWLEIKDFRRFDGLFNWTMSYRRNSDVPLSYGFIGRRRVASKNWNNKDLLRIKQNKAIWFVSNCRTDSNREEYITRLKEIYPVDIIGGCSSNSCRPAETKKCYAKMAKHYKFYLSFENAICRDYVTEKLFNPFEYNIVPVTFGGADYSNLVPEHSIVNAMEFKNPEDLGNFLWKISRNDTEYLSYFAWKKYYRSYLQPWMCDLCEKLHEKSLPQVKYNLDKWWNEDYSCLRWSNHGFVSSKKQIFPMYHTKIFN